MTPNNKWVSQPETLNAGFKGTDSVFVRQVMPVYIQMLQKSKETNDYTQANKVLTGIKNFQKKFGAQVIPADDKIELEIAYNKFSIFSRLAKYLGFAGALLIFVVVAQIFSDRKVFNYIVKGLIAIIIGLFVFHTLGLGARWYISGNAPWSNAYESIIYVAWATMLFGLYFGRKICFNHCGNNIFNSSYFSIRTPKLARSRNCKLTACVKFVLVVNSRFYHCS